MRKLSNQIAAYIQDSMFTQPTIKDALDLLDEQYPQYQNFDYLGYGFSSLILKATNESQQIALKIVIVQENKKEIETAKKEYEFLKSMSKNCYFVGVNSCFYLKDEEIEKYFIIEMEICKCSLSQLLQEFRKDKVKLDERVKEILTIQILDALNMLHKKEIVHRDIKPENILISSNSLKKDSPFTIKLGDLGLASQLKVKNSKSFLTGKKGTEGYMSLEATEGQCRKQSDLFALGIVILELDNYLTFEYSSISNLEFPLLQREGISALSKYNLNRKSFLFQAAEIFLNPDYKKRLSALDILERFLTKKEYQSVLVYSVFTEFTVNQTSQLPIPNHNNKKNQQLAIFNQQIKNILIEQPQLSKEDLQKLENLMYKSESEKKLIDQLEDDNLISPEGIKLALKALYLSKKFSLFQYLGRGASGIVFGVKNIIQKRDTVIKLSLAKDKIQIMKEVSILKKVCSPYIVRFYDYGIFKDEMNNEYVWYEFEKCQSTLTHYLETHQDEINDSPDLKMSFALQIIDSINTLHRQDILHGDIKLDNFLISEEESGRPIVKLSDFDQSSMLNEPDYDNYYQYPNIKELILGHQYLFTKGKYGTPVFRSPERQLQNNFPSTFLSESFSVGLCLVLLENYVEFDKEFVKNYFFLLQPYEIPFMNCQHLFNKESYIYKWAISLLAFNPFERLFLKQIVDNFEDSLTPLYSKFHSQTSIKQMHLKSSCLNLMRDGFDEVDQLFKSNLGTFSKSLQSLKLDLHTRGINKQQIISFSQSLSKLIELQSLNLNLDWNVQLEEGMLQFSSALSKLIKISSLTLHLQNFREEESEGIIQLSSALSNLTQLSYLHLNLNYNKVVNKEIISLSSTLSKLDKLSYLSFKVDSQKIQNEGFKEISMRLSKLPYLLKLNLDFSSTEIESEGINYLLQVLPNLMQLEALTLSFRQFTDKNPRIISFSNLSKLTSLSYLSLDLANSHIQIQGAIDLSQAISQLPQLQILNLDLMGNNIQIQGVSELSFSLSKLISLQELNLNISSNMIQNQGLISLKAPLLELKCLQRLSLFLSDNKIESEGLKELSSCLSKLTQLSTLSLSLSSNLVYKGIDQFSQALSKLTELQLLSLYLGKINLFNEGLIQLSQALSKQYQLLYLTLTLENNLIQDEGVIQLSSDLCQLRKLQYLTLDLSGSYLGYSNKNSIKNLFYSKLQTERFKLKI